MEIGWLPCAAEGYLRGTISGDLSGSRCMQTCKRASEDPEMQLIFLSFLPGSLQLLAEKQAKQGRSSGGGLLDWKVLERCERNKGGEGDTNSYSPVKAMSET